MWLPINELFYKQTRDGRVRGTTVQPYLGVDMPDQLVQVLIPRLRILIVKIVTHQPGNMAAPRHIVLATMIKIIQRRQSWSTWMPSA